MFAIPSLKRSVTLLTAAVCCVSSLWAVPAVNDPYAGQYDVLTTPKNYPNAYRQGELIVKLRTENVAAPVKLKSAKGKVMATASAKGLNALISKYGLEEAEELMPLTGANVTPKMLRAKSLNGKDMTDSDLSSLYVLRFDAKRVADITSVAEEFSELEEVEYAEPNYIVYACSIGTAADYTTDPMYSKQWGIPAIGLDKLWDVPVVNTKRPVIAILDTGVDITHPDLADNIWTNELEANGADNADDDGNGFADDIHGWDFVNQSPRMRDNNGHGTHCAGIAAACGGNGIGITGANPDALIMPITVMQSDGTGDVATIIKGIDYATANGADVLSMSFGGYSESRAEHDALAKAYQKALLVAAAGNSGLSIIMPMFPAAYSFVLGVEASVDSEGYLASFSNYDEDGPVTSLYDGLYNYELRAPGTNILSTFPGGQYKTLNGTSMACPLVAGAISRLIMARDISSKEELFGDLINTAKGNINIFDAYSLTDADRKPTLSLVTYRLDDAKMGDGDGRPDAGETIRIYPTFRNTWGNARNITYRIRLAENEDPNIVEFMDGESHFISNLSSYASAEAESPFILKISPDCVDGRHIRLVLTATCDNISEPLEQEIILTAENGVELGGVIVKDMTLYPDTRYIVTSTLAIPEGVTLTIQPGVILKFKDDTGISVSGSIEAHGEPGNMITFTKDDLGQGRVSNFLFLSENCRFSYVKFELLHFYPKGGYEYGGFYNGYFENCIFKYISSQSSFVYEWEGSTSINKSILYDIESCLGLSFSGLGFYTPYDNCILNKMRYASSISNTEQLSTIRNSVVFNNYIRSFSGDLTVSGVYAGSIPGIFTPDKPNYFGSSLESKVRPTIYDILYPGSGSIVQYDLSNMLTRPPHQAHGIVWKVVVNDYDAQDEYELLPPLGVGRHKFEVYFNRKMNHDKTPMIAMGVRDPYTQIAISEDGEWRTEVFDGEELDIYTAYLTIKGKDNFDGVNTIYVAEAEDDEFFEIPIEDVRFHVNVQSAGSMSNGFMAEAGVGRVTLTWENPEDNFDDMLGYNLYRYTLDDNYVAGDTIRLNEQLLDIEEFVDYDIVPGTTYNYYYKVMRTSLDENAPSKVVSATPRAAGKGDANASGNVDVADVVTEVNYMVGRDPKPFMYEAADVNDDEDIDILDVVGTVNIIMAPEDTNDMMAAMSVATYTVENGVLYVDSSVELAGVQAEISGMRGNTEISVLSDLRGMENTGDWVSDNTYRFVAFSLSGKTLDSGRHALLSIGDAELSDLILVDPRGNRVMAVKGTESGISSVVMQQMKTPTPNPFVDVIKVPVIMGTEGSHDVVLSLHDLSGAMVLSKCATLGYGEHNVVLNGGSLSSGFYMLTLTVDGVAVQTHKVIKK